LVQDNLNITYEFLNYVMQIMFTFFRLCNMLQLLW